MTDTPIETGPGTVGAEPLLRLDFAAISDVGRVRKDNQDSGYAGPWLLSVCDGVGGAARGDVASSTAITSLRSLDVDPRGADVSADLLERVTDALHSAHETIGHLVDEDPALNGTSTTATVALFDGHRAGIGHVGDSRAYLFRDGEISQLTTDHTFVQSLIDEGRITPEEARVHPHRNLILKALDGVHEAEPDLFLLELVPGDRLLLCSDGACGVLDDGRLADICSTGTPDFAAVELVRASLEAGSSDNVTCIVADVVSDPVADPAAGSADATDVAPVDPAEAPTAETPLPAASAGSLPTEPLVVGAAAVMPRTRGRAQAGGPRALFRGHRSGDTGELEPIEADLPEEVAFAIPSDPIAPETAELARYAPLPPERHVGLRRLLWLLLVVGVLWIAAAGVWSFVQHQYYVGEDENGVVVIYRGVSVDVPVVNLHRVVETSDLTVAELLPVNQQRVQDGSITADSLDAAQDKLRTLGADRSATTSGDSGNGTGDGGSTPTPSAPSSQVTSGGPDTSTVPAPDNGSGG